MVQDCVRSRSPNGSLNMEALTAAGQKTVSVKLSEEPQRKISKQREADNWNYPSCPVWHKTGEQDRKELYRKRAQRHNAACSSYQISTFRIMFQSPGKSLLAIHLIRNELIIAKTCQSCFFFFPETT